MFNVCRIVHPTRAYDIETPSSPLSKPSPIVRSSRRSRDSRSIIISMVGGVATLGYARDQAGPAYLIRSTRVIGSILLSLFVSFTFMVLFMY
jgi:hypothetical protein